MKIYTLNIEEVLKGTGGLIRTIRSIPPVEEITLLPRVIFTLRPTPWQLRNVLDTENLQEKMGEFVNPFDNNGEFRAVRAHINFNYTAKLTVNFDKNGKIKIISFTVTKYPGSVIVFNHILYSHTVEGLLGEEVLNVINSARGNSISREFKSAIYRLKFRAIVSLNFVNAFTNLSFCDTILDGGALKESLQTIEKISTILNGLGNEPREIFDNAIFVGSLVGY
jgi:hypothetical protein